ncbi:hypothetical protein CC78DRAFT_452944 [Lojkania enalia]|uniref:AhpC/TSA antioxidant enzyme-domain-containing protein n=1 Tax=Lojkania enalia TaxID=147567 RepID=A0A9P4TQW7_9PLEO|nr:hypothetical protein CC78DRAFT_452944 [Didymosphaeria enalia]
MRTSISASEDQTARAPAPVLSSGEHVLPSSIAAPSTEPTPPPLQGDSQGNPKVSTSVDTPNTTSPPFSPSSTTPVLEKEELDFSGNVDVNDDLPTEKMMKQADNLHVLDAEGVSRPFKELYSAAGVAPRQLIIFVRHFFCGNCQEYLRTLSSSITPESLLSLPTPTFITVIGCGRPELIDMYIKETGCPFPVYADPTRKLYDYLGMTRTFDLGKKPSYIHSNLFVTSVQSIMQGFKTGTKALSGGDFKQVGGEFLFEEGQCVWVHRMRNTRDHAEIGEIRRRIGLDDTKPPLRKRWSHGIKQIKDGKRSASWGGARSKSRTKDEKTGEVVNEEDELKLNGRPTV